MTRYTSVSSGMEWDDVKARKADDFSAVPGKGVKP